MWHAQNLPSRCVLTFGCWGIHCVKLQTTPAAQKTTRLPPKKQKLQDQRVCVCVRNYLRTGAGHPCPAARALFLGAERALDAPPAEQTGGARGPAAKSIAGLPPHAGRPQQRLDGSPRMTWRCWAGVKTVGQNRACGRTLMIECRFYNPPASICAILHGCHKYGILGSLSLRCHLHCPQSPHKGTKSCAESAKERETTPRCAGS